MAARTSSSQWPTWTMAPTLNFWQGDPKTVLLSRYIKNPLNEPMGYSLEVGSAAFPSGVAFSGANNVGVSWTGTGTNGVTANVRFRVTNLLTGYHVASPYTQIKIAGAIVLLPSAPINVTATAISDSGIRVAWQAGAGGSTPTSYRIYRANSVTGPFSVIATDSASPYDDTTLSAAVTAYYAVAAVDANNAVSSLSLIASATTYLGPPAAPVNVSAVGTSDSNIRVTWVAGMGGAPAALFRVYRAEVQSGPFSMVSEDVASVTTYDDGSNNPSTAIYFYITAVDISSVESAASAVVGGTTLDPPVPAKPTNVTATALSSTTIRVAWAAVSGASVTNYRVYSSPTGLSGTYTQLATVGSGTLLYDDTVAPQETKFYQVSALNANGESQISLAVSATTPGLVLPATPVSVSATGTTTTNIRVAWSAGAGGSAPTGYRLYSSPNQTGGPVSFLASDTASPYDDGSVVAGETKWYAISATNANGESQRSTPVSGTALPALLPAMPVSVSVSTISQSVLRVAWLPGAGGSTITGYKIYWSATEGGSYVLLTTATSSPYDNTGLPGGTTRWYKIAATDGENDSAQTAPVSATTLALADVPTGVSAVGISNSAIRVSWSASVGAVSYKVYKAVSADGTYLVVGSGITDLTFDHTLTDSPSENLTRWYRVTAVNAAGESAQSVSASGTTFGFVGPAVPVNVVAVPSQGQIALTWQAGSGGTAVTAWKVYRSLTSGGAATMIASGPNPRYTNTGLSAGTTYYYRISAVDASLVESAKSAEVQSTTPGALTPSVPTNITADAISQTTIRVAWTAGAGGSTITGYKVYRATTAGGTYALLATVTALSYNDSTLTAGQTRSYRVSATDASSESGQSLIATATTWAADPPDPDVVDWYVSGTGNDGNAGTSTTSALRTIQAGVNKATAGQTIAVMNGTYPITATIVTKVAGTAASPITLKALSGHAPVVTGGPTSAQVQLSHAYNYWGEGIELRGSNNVSASNTNSANITIFQASKPERSVIVAANNCKVSFICRKAKLDWVWVNAGISRARMSGMDCYVAGAMDKGDGADGGNGMHVPTSSTQHTLMEQCRFATGGHNSLQIAGSPNLMRECLLTCSWEEAWGATLGNRIWTFMDSGARTVIEDSVLHSSLITIENPQRNAMMKMNQGNMLMKRCFLIYQRASDGGMVTMLSPANPSDGGPPTATDQRYLHMTMHDATGQAIGVTDNGGVGGFSSPFYFINLIISGNTATYAMEIQYRSSRSGVNGWRNLFFFKKCGFQANYNIRIRDLDGATATLTKTVTQWVTDEPANFAPEGQACFVANPNYVSTALPASTVPVTALAQARANLLPTNVAYLGTGSWVTRVNKVGGYSGASIITVDDGKMFRDPMGWSHLTGDVIYVEGAGARTITAIAGNDLTVTPSVTCGDNAKVWLGNSATPNVGAA